MNTTKKHIISVRYFGAESWCVPCKIFAPIMRKLKEEGYSIELIDIDYNQELASQNNIKSVPTTIIEKDGIEVNRFVGGKTYKEMKNILDNMLK